MGAAVDRQRLVYLVGRGEDGAVRLSSPLEAHVPSTLCLALAALDAGWEGSPTFACLEVEYGEVDDAVLAGRWEEARGRHPETRLSLYEVDLGLRHVTRRASVRVGPSAHHLVAVPGGADGPGGVLVCEAERILWLSPSGRDPVSVRIPRASGEADRSTQAARIVNCSALVRAKGRLFFHLLQIGADLFRVALRLGDEGGAVRALALRYFESCGAASAMAVLRSGFLLVAGEAGGNHTAYQIQSLGEHPDEPEFCGEAEAEAEAAGTYERRALRNLAATAERESLAPLTAAALANPGSAEEAPQLFACQGTGAASGLNVLRHGLGVAELAHSELPAAPTGLWTLKQALGDPADAFLVISFAGATTVLRVGGEAIEEVPESGFALDTASLAAFQLASEAMVQVHPRGFRQVSPAAGIVEWRTPPGVSVVAAAYNTRQLVLALSSRALVYFELEPAAAGLLAERRTSPALPEAPTAMHLAPVPAQRLRSRWLALGTDAGLVRILSLDPGDGCLEPVSLQALAAHPTSLLIGLDAVEVGLANGVLVSLSLDPASGALGDPRTRYVGPAPVTLRPCGDSLLVLSSRAWLRHARHRQQAMSPLLYEPLGCATAFASEAAPAGIVASVGASLRIIAVDTEAASPFARHRTPLPCTPKRLAFSPPLGLLAVHGALVDPSAGHVLGSPSLAEGESVTAQAFVTFHERPGERMLAVGIARNLTLAPRTAQAAFVDLYLVKPTGHALELVHRTRLDEPGQATQMIPSAMAAFAGRLLVSAGPALRLYDLGRARLLKKCEARLPTFAACLATQGFRLAVGDAHQGLLLLQYLPGDNQFLAFADEAGPRATSCLAFLDYETLAGGDRFGNVFVARLPAGLGEAVDIDGTVASPANKHAGLLGAPHKLERLVEFHLGDTPVAMHRAALSPGARQAIHYATVSGAIGVLLPLATRSEALLLQNLELAMRTESPAGLGGRDHLAYRSAYYPLKGAIDGDLCEAFLHLPEDRQARLAQALDMPSAALLQRKIQALRSSIGF
jgi:splicing factor 3B subunit 3